MIILSIRQKIVTYILTLLSSHLLAGQSLADLYKSGKILISPEMIINDETMLSKDFFGLPTQIVTDEQNHIIICDYKASNLKIFNPEGRYLGTIGKFGQGPGDFNGPIEVAYSKSRFYVREANNLRLSVLDRKGSFIKSVRIDTQKGIWQRIRALPDGRLIVQKYLVNREDPEAAQDFILDLYSAEMEFLKTIYRYAVKLNKYIYEPRFMNIPIPFAPSVYWGVQSNGNIVLGFSENYEFEIFNPDNGIKTRIRHPWSPSEITADDKARYFQSISSTMISDRGERIIKRGASEIVANNTEYPKIFPAFKEIEIDYQDNILIIPWISMSDKSGNPIDAFDGKGNFINRVTFDNYESIPHSRSWWPWGFWCIRPGQDGEYQIIKYRISQSKTLR
jgi:hypothetical protein